MKRSTDNKVRQILKSKFADYSQESDEDLWQAIQPRINLSRRNLLANANPYIVIILLTALLITYFIYTPDDQYYENFVDHTPQSSIHSEKSIKQMRLNPFPETINLPGNASGSNVPQVTILPGSPVSGKEFDNFHLAVKQPLKSKAPLYSPLNFEGAITTFPEGKKENLPSPPKHFTIEIASGILQNYYVMKPASNDLVYFLKSESNGPVSWNRIGFEPQATIEISLVNQLSFIVSSSIAYVRSQINQTYIDIRDQSVSQYRYTSDISMPVWSFLISNGLKFQLRGRWKKTIDLRIEYDRTLKSLSKINSLINFPDNLLNLNAGVSLYLNHKQHELFLRPYWRYSFARTYSGEAPLNVTPFSFGLAAGIGFNLTKKKAN